MSASCRKTGESCRFGYPRPHINKTSIIRKDTTVVDNQPDMPTALVKRILSRVYQTLDKQKKMLPEQYSKNCSLGHWRTIS